MNIWKRFRSCGWIAGLLLSLFFLLAGGRLGQFALIWKKAAVICLECIGIG